MTSPASLPVPGPDRELTPTDRASRSAANAARRVAKALVVTHAPAEVLERAAADLAAVAELLEVDAGTSRYDSTRGLGPAVDPVILERHPFLGESNPGAPPVRLALDGEDVTATVTFDARHEGMPTRAHGGWIAALFDQVVAIAGARAVGQPAMTGTLTVRYLVPTPIGCELSLHATATRSGERTVRAHATLGPDGTVTAEADAVLVIGRDPLPGPATPDAR
jgi:acyl-coenzyme A thioesterase PaaI-like protein